MSQQFGSTEFDKNKVIVLLYAAIVAVVLSWYAFNSSLSIMEVAKTYWVLMLTSLILMILFFMLSKFETVKDFDVPAPVLWEKDSIFSDVKSLSALFNVVVIFAALFLFFYVGSQPTFQLTAVPSYSFVPDGTQQIILVLISTVAEDFFAWVAVPLLLMTTFMLVLSKLGINKNAILIATILVCIINPFIWAFFHNARYGSDAVSLQATFVFGAIMTLYVMITKNIFLPLLVHPANNLGRTIFQTFKVSNAMGVFWFIAIVLVIVLVLYFWSKKTKGRLK